MWPDESRFCKVTIYVVVKHRLGLKCICECLISTIIPNCECSELFGKFRYYPIQHLSVCLSVFYLLLDHWRDRNETFRRHRHQPLDGYCVSMHICIIIYMSLSHHLCVRRLQVTQDLTPVRSNKSFSFPCLIISVSCIPPLPPFVPVKI